MMRSGKASSLVNKHINVLGEWHTLTPQGQRFLWTLWDLALCTYVHKNEHVTVHFYPL